MRFPLLSAVATLCLSSLLLSVPLVAQKASGGGKGHGSTGAPISGVPSNNGSMYGMSGYGSTYGSNPWLASVATCNDVWACPLSTPRPMPATPTNDDPDCFLTPVSGIHSPTVSLTRLEVPEKAKQEDDKACSALKHRKISEAEEHLLKAVKLYPEYAGAWVLLGQVQELEQKSGDAVESCSRAQKIDVNYAPSYLCMAYLDTADKKWEQLKQVTEALLQLHPMYATNAYYYNAVANLNLNNLSAAEISARRGIADSKQHHQSHLHLVLAQIYEKAGNRQSEIAELHEYLKCDPHGNDVENVNHVLKAIENPATVAKQ